MLQLELYVADVKQTADVFAKIFAMKVIKESIGYRHLRNNEGMEIMFFNPSESNESDGNWPMPQNGAGGTGVEIVIVTNDIVHKREAVQKFGYSCSELRHTPWNTVEFTFRLKEGYLLRIKQPKISVETGC